MFVGIIGKNVWHVYLVIGKYGFCENSEREHCFMILNERDVTKVSSDVLSGTFDCWLPS